MQTDQPGNTITSDQVAEGFKAAFREHPAGVALITANTAEGPVGLTASSVASVGLDPVALTFSVTRATGSAGGLLSADTFLVHLLDARHVAIASEFAVSGGERFTPEQGWQALPTGEPHLPGVRAALRCRALQVTPVGASSAVIAEVLEVVSGEPGAPLVYIDRAFRVLPEGE
jgi:flavin reductase (DIM6/NTAB) family NADH-FMN oxidoreductase RutF